MFGRGTEPSKSSGGYVRWAIQLNGRLGFLTDANPVIGTGFEWMIGCQKAMEDAHLSYTQSGAMTSHDGYWGIQQLLERHSEFTAVA